MISNKKSKKFKKDYRKRKERKNYSERKLDKTNKHSSKKKSLFHNKNINKKFFEERIIKNISKFLIIFLLITTILFCNFLSQDEIEKDNYGLSL